MSSISADTTNDVRGKVTLLGAVVLSVADLTAVLASLVFIVTQSTVECGEFTQLIAFQLILAFWDGGSLETVSKYKE